MSEKNLRILGSRGPLPHVKRSCADFRGGRRCACGSLPRPARKFRRKSRGFIRLAMSSARELIYRAGGESDRSRARVNAYTGCNTVRWQESLACSISFEGLTTRGSSLFHLFRIHNISFREQAWWPISFPS